MAIAGGSTILLYFIKTQLQNLVLSCFFESLSSLGESALYAVMVDLFPTRLRVMATSLALTFGRSGAVLGNMIFGQLIDINCAAPIAIFAAMLLLSGFLCLFLPNTGQESLT